MRGGALSAQQCLRSLGAHLRPVSLGEGLNVRSIGTPDIQKVSSPYLFSFSVHRFSKIDDNMPNISVLAQKNVRAVNNISSVGRAPSIGFYGRFDQSRPN